MVQMQLPQYADSPSVKIDRPLIYSIKCMAWAGVGRREMRDENREAGDARREKEDGRCETAEVRRQRDRRQNMWDTEEEG